MDKLSSLPGYVLTRAAAVSLASLNKRLSELGLRHSHATLLILIDSHSGLTQSDAGKMLDIQRANMVPLVSRLIDSKLIQKTRVDGRSQRLTLTANGKKTLKKVHGVIDTHEANLTKMVPEDLRPHLLPILQALWHSNVENT